MLAHSLAIMSITSASALSLSATSTASDVVSRFRPSLPSYVARGGVAVVTGGNSGIGTESARALLDVGCFVVLRHQVPLRNSQASACNLSPSLPSNLLSKSWIEVAALGLFTSGSKILRINDFSS